MLKSKRLLFLIFYSTSAFCMQKEGVKPRSEAYSISNKLDFLSQKFNSNLNEKLNTFLIFFSKTQDVDKKINELNFEQLKFIFSLTDNWNLAYGNHIQRLSVIDDSELIHGLNKIKQPTSKLGSMKFVIARKMDRLIQLSNLIGQANPILSKIRTTHENLFFALNAYKNLSNQLEFFSVALKDNPKISGDEIYNLWQKNKIKEMWGLNQTLWTLIQESSSINDALFFCRKLDKTKYLNFKIKYFNKFKEYILMKQMIKSSSQYKKIISNADNNTNFNSHLSLIISNERVFANYFEELESDLELTK